MKLGFSLQLWIEHNRNYDNFHKMLDELSLLSYDGIEVAYPFVREFFTSDQLRKLVELHNMTISSTYSAIDFRTPESIIACERKARENIDYYSNAGAKHFLLDGQVEKPAHETSMGYVFNYTDKQLAEAAECTNRLAKYAKEHGMQLSWHTHWGTFFEDQEMFDKFWEQTDPDLVKLCPDVGQCQLVGVDPVEFVKKHINRITHYVHYKDIEINARPKRVLWPGMTIPNNDGGYGVDAKGRWVELGRGDVDFKSITEILLGAGFDGWITCDLDCSPYPARLSAAACKDYLNKGLGIIGDRDKNK